MSTDIDTQMLCRALAAITGLHESAPEIITLAARCEVDYSRGAVDADRKFLPWLAWAMSLSEDGRADFVWKKQTLIGVNAHLSKSLD